MIEATEIPQPDSPPPVSAGVGFVAEIWIEHRTIFKALLADGLLFICVLGALLFCSGALQLLARAGFEKSRLMILEALHYYAYLVVWAMFLIDLILKLFVHLFRGQH